MTVVAIVAVFVSVFASTLVAFEPWRRQGRAE